MDVDLKTGGQGVDPIQIVAAEGADVGISNAPSIYAANEKGANLVAFAAVFQTASNAVVCRADRKISQFSDLAGKTFGSKGPSDDATLTRLWKRNGIDPRSIKIRPIGPSSITEIIAGVVDCQLGFSVNEPITLRKAGVTPVVFNLPNYGLGGQGDVYFTRQDYLDKNQQVLVRFLQATGKGWGVFLDNPTAAAQFIGDSKLIDGLDIDQQKSQATAMAELLTNDNTKQHGLLYLNDTLWQDQASQALDQGLVSKPPDINKARTLAVLDAANLPKR